MTNDTNSTDNGVLTLAEWKSVISGLYPFGHRHRQLLMTGILFALPVVALRCALPWLMHSAIDLLQGPKQAILNNMWMYGTALLGSLVLLGLADHILRLQFARFAISLAKSLREKIFSNLTRQEVGMEDIEEGELISRLIGDLARMKAGIKGFLVHVAVNLLFFGLVSMILLSRNIVLSAGFIVAFLAVTAMGMWAAAWIYRKASLYRQKEGDLAVAASNMLNREIADNWTRELDDVSSRSEASITRIQGWATWGAHSMAGLLVFFVLMFGFVMVARGDLSRSDLILFLLYALSVRTPLVHMARQGARTGKILACATRLTQLLGSIRDAEPIPEAAPSWSRLRVEKAQVRASKKRGGKRRLGPISFQMESGQTLAVRGKTGDGKSALLELIAGQVRLSKGKVFLDETPLANIDKHSLQGIIHVTECPAWPRQSITQTLSLRERAFTVNDAKILRQLGLRRILTPLKKGIHTKAQPSEFSLHERRGIGLAAAFLGSYSLILLDGTLQGYPKRKAGKILRKLRAAHPDAIIVVSTPSALPRSSFDLELRLEKGREVLNEPQVRISKPTSNALAATGIRA